MNDTNTPSINHDLSPRYSDAPAVPVKCPNCGRDYNAWFPTGTAKMTAPESGDWCIWLGYFFIHEELKYPVTESKDS